MNQIDEAQGGRACERCGKPLIFSHMNDYADPPVEAWVCPDEACRAKGLKFAEIEFGPVDDKPDHSDVLETLLMCKDNPSIIPSAMTGDMLDALMEAVYAAASLADKTDIAHQPTTPEDLADCLKGVSAFLSAIGRDGMMGLVEQAIGMIGKVEAREAEREVIEETHAHLINDDADSAVKTLEKWLDADFNRSLKRPTQEPVKCPKSEDGKHTFIAQPVLDSERGKCDQCGSPWHMEHPQPAPQAQPGHVDSLDEEILRTAQASGLELRDNAPIAFVHALAMAVERRLSAMWVK